MASSFNRDLPRACAYCAYGQLTSSGEEVLCPKHGVTGPRDSCRHYRYDPIKRVPKRTKIADGYDPEDFFIS